MFHNVDCWIRPERQPNLRKIIRIAKDRLLKYGPQGNIKLEAENMRYVAESTTIPLPRVHEIQTHDSGVMSILMDYIEGQTLQDAWSGMTSSQKISVAQELHEYILQLRALKPEQDGQLTSEDICVQHSARFDEYLFSRTAISTSGFGWDFVSSKWSEGVVFAHGDLAPRNILVDDLGHVTAILDWEFAGWHPEWWDTVRAYTFCDDVPGWTAYLSAVFPPGHDTEYMAVAFARHIVR